MGGKCDGMLAQSPLVPKQLGGLEDGLVMLDVVQLAGTIFLVLVKIVRGFC